MGCGVAMGKKNNPGCELSDCCGICDCNEGTMHVTFDNVALNFAPAMRPCGSADPVFPGYTPDPAWFNGVTFIFNPEWDLAALTTNNPNAFQGMTATQCRKQAGSWSCLIPTYPLSGAAFIWGINIEWTPGSGSVGFEVLIILSCAVSRGSLFERSETTLRYRYDNICPTGSYSLFSRTNAFTAGSFDFTAATADIVWA